MTRLARYEAAGIASGRPLVLGARAMVVTPSAWASSVGLEVLRGGGTAVDAAVAVGAALSVAHPNQCGLGGDAFWLIRPRGAETSALNASGRAPAGAAPGDLLDRGLTEIPPRSAFAVTAPGMVAGWRDAHARFGRTEFARLLAPAIEAADRGLAVTPLLARYIRRSEEILRARPEATRIFLPGGRAPAVGHVLRQPDLAGTLRALAHDPGAFYAGAPAEAIAAAIAAEGGWLDAADLAAHTSDWVAPLTLSFGGWDVQEMPPNSQGMTALMGLALIGAAGLGAADPPAAWADAGIAAARTFMAVRDREIADPASMRRTPQELLDLGFLRAAQREPAGPAAAGATPAGTPSTSRSSTRTARRCRASRASSTSSAAGSSCPAPASSSRTAGARSRSTTPMSTRCVPAGVPCTRSRPDWRCRTGARRPCSAAWAATGRPRSTSSC